MRRVLVTGASGFVGRHALPHLLTRGFEVHAVAHAAPADLAQGVQSHPCDLMNPVATSELLARVRPTHLLHLAWTTTPGEYWESPDNLRWTAATLGLLLAFADHGGERVTIAGTCAEYDWSHPLAVEAKTPLRPTSLYGTAKNALREISAKFAENRGLGFGWGRLFFPYGPGEQPSRLTASVIRALLAGEEALCSHGEQVRDFIYVDDAAAAFAALLDSEVSGPVNIASGEGHRLRDLIDRIGDELGRPELIRLGARPTPAHEVPVLTADITRLRSEVGYAPATQLAPGVRACISFWRQRSTQPGTRSGENR